MHLHTRALQTINLNFFMTESILIIDFAFIVHFVCLPFVIVMRTIASLLRAVQLSTDPFQKAFVESDYANVTSVPVSEINFKAVKDVDDEAKRSVNMVTNAK